VTQPLALVFAPGSNIRFAVLTAPGEPSTRLRLWPSSTDPEDEMAEAAAMERGWLAEGREFWQRRTETVDGRWRRGWEVLNGSGKVLRVEWVDAEPRSPAEVSQDPWPAPPRWRRQRKARAA
jgi:hypothetical protein